MSSLHQSTDQWNAIPNRFKSIRGGEGECNAASDTSRYKFEKLEKFQLSSDWLKQTNGERIVESIQVRHGWQVEEPVANSVDSDGTGWADWNSIQIQGDI